MPTVLRTLFVGMVVVPVLASTAVAQQDGLRDYNDGRQRYRQDPRDFEQGRRDFGQNREAYRERRRAFSQDRSGSTPGAQGNLDPMLVEWLIMDNRAEIVMAQAALDQAQTRGARQFAQQMIEDHSRFIRQLQTVADRGAGGQAAILLGIRQEVARQNLQTLMDELSRYRGTMFDRAYMDDQVKQHLIMINTLDVFRQYASPELQLLLGQGIRTTEGHLQMARQLNRQLARQTELSGQAGF